MDEQQGEQRDEPGRKAEKSGEKAKLVFTDPLDRQSSDDTDSGWGEARGTGGSGGDGRGLDWYVSQRPPHHGG